MEGYANFPKVFDKSATNNTVKLYLPFIFSKEPLVWARTA